MMTEKQRRALQQLERAFAACKKAGICFCGMDDNLHYATKEAIADSPERNSSDYSGVARAVQNQELDDEAGKVDTHWTYGDSGGW
jgi:hypothetical protein